MRREFSSPPGSRWQRQRSLTAQSAKPDRANPHGYEISCFLPLGMAKCPRKWWMWRDSNPAPDDFYVSRPFTGTPVVLPTGPVTPEQRLSPGRCFLSSRNHTVTSTAHGALATLLFIILKKKPPCIRLKNARRGHRIQSGLNLNAPSNRF